MDVRSFIKPLIHWTVAYWGEHGERHWEYLSKIQSREDVVHARKKFQIRNTNLLSLKDSAVIKKVREKSMKVKTREEESKESDDEEVASSAETKIKPAKH